MPTKTKASVMVFVVLGISGMLLFGMYRRPLGPALELPTPASTLAPPTLTIPPPDEPETSTATQTVRADTPTPQPLCGGPAVMNILAIGSDARGDHYLYGLADVIRLVRVDFVNRRVSILEMPRDLWVSPQFMTKNPKKQLYPAHSAGDCPELSRKPVVPNLTMAH